MMIVGLRSGKELVVQDSSFFIQVGDKSNPVLKQVFISPDQKRRVIVSEADIEFYDEPNTQEYLDKLEKSIKETVETTKVHPTGVDYV